MQTDDAMTFGISVESRVRTNYLSPIDKVVRSCSTLLHTVRSRPFSASNESPAHPARRQIPLKTDCCWCRLCSESCRLFWKVSTGIFLLVATFTDIIYHHEGTVFSLLIVAQNKHLAFWSRCDSEQNQNVKWPLRAFALRLLNVHSNFLFLLQ